jgi:hypothetical protein
MRISGPRVRKYICPNSRLNTLFTRPNPEKVQENYEKTMALKIMSLDLNSAEKTTYSKAGVRLPSLQKK